MNKILYFLFIVGLLASCDAAKNKTKEAINDGGEIIGQGLGELGKGIDEGLDESLALTINLSDRLQHSGIELGKVTIDNWHSHKIDIYVIFNETFNDTVKVKLADHNGLEMRRTSLPLNGTKGDAFYVTCEFDERAHIESDSKVTME